MRKLQYNSSWNGINYPHPQCPSSDRAGTRKSSLSPPMYPNKWKLNSMLLNNQWAQEGIKRKIKKYLEINENENTVNQIYWMYQRQYQEGNL